MTKDYNRSSKRDYATFAGGVFRPVIFRQFVKFSIVGIGNTIVDFIVYLTLTRTFGFYYLYANLISVALAKVFSFTFNSRWTFRTLNDKRLFEAGKFVMVNISYYILYNCIFFVLVSIIGMGDINSKIIATVIGLLWNFMAYKFWTFKKTEYHAA